ncbi:hypothetical protein JMN23_25940 [Bacillus sp. RHFB]|nr:hypothetical protein [Bacillus sp. RHFB]
MKKISILGWVWISFIASQVFGIIIQESFVIADDLWWPFRWITNWQISDQNKFYLLIRYGLMLFIYFFLIYGLVAFIKKVFRKSDSDATQVYLFERELTAALEAAFDPNPNAAIVSNEVKRLFEEIKNRIARFYNVKSDRIRVHMFFLDEQSGLHELSRMRWGASITPQQEDIDKDALRIMVGNQQNDKAIARWTNADQQFPSGDTKVYLLVRNLGHPTLGLLISFRDPIDVDSKLDKLSVEVTPMTLLGYVDRIRNIVVNYV